MARPDFDAVVAGAGIAGAAAAAALAQLGWTVLVVEPGQHDDRRLAGELIHPEGVAGLSELGLLAASGFTAAVRLSGFAVHAADGTAALRLPYGSTYALALDHAQLRAALAAALRQTARITLREGVRVVTVRPTPEGVGVTLSGNCAPVTCRLLVGADGASSSVRAMAGIRHWRGGRTMLAGYRVPVAALPGRDAAHVFLGAHPPLLAYAFGDYARVLLEGPTHLADLPAPVREALRLAMGRGRPLRFASRDVAVNAVARQRVVLVGDAAGSCHPITASGMTMAIGDALRLRGALHRHGSDTASALRLYAAGRRPHQRARVFLAGALRDALEGAGPEMRFLRAALLRHWQADTRNCGTSMALLGSTNTTMVAILTELARVLQSGLAGSADVLPRELGLLARLSVPMTRHIANALRIQ